jgi:hypothetical protein
VWVYALTILVYVLAGPLFPKQGKETALLFVSSFWGSLYFFLFSLVSPLLALETAFFIILSPVTCVASGLVKRLENLRLKDALIRACLEALTLGGALLGLALIREPLGFGTLSLPGGSEGIVEFFGGGGEVFPVRVIGSSAGAFLLIGYGMALFRRVKRKRLQEDAS